MNVLLQALATIPLAVYVLLAVIAIAGTYAIYDTWRWVQQRDEFRSIDDFDDTLDALEEAVNR